jgi:hypothetical protein
MEFKNYLNLASKDLDRSIYRIVEFKRFQQIFEGRSNTLVSPALWEDPFENFILKCPIVLVTGEIGHAGFRDQYFGQCWTLKSASDAMWRIYSHDKQGIRIRTTIRKLLWSLANHCKEWADVCAFIGKVQYLNEKKLTEFAHRTWDRVDPENFAKTLLVKRPAFSHEGEVRLIYFERDDSRRGEKLYTYPVDPHDLIGQVMCDPRLGPEGFSALSEQIRGTGFKGQLLRSLLYAPPPEFRLKFKA